MISFAGCNSYDEIKLIAIGVSKQHEQDSKSESEQDSKSESEKGSEQHTEISLCKIIKPEPFKKRKIYGESSGVSFEPISVLKSPDKNKSD